MKNFVIVPASEGLRREFKITWGLRASYGSSGRIYDLEEAVRAAHCNCSDTDGPAIDPNSDKPTKPSPI